MDIFETIVSFFMLALTIGILVFLVILQRRTKNQRTTMYPFVLLIRNGGETVPLGTYAIREHAVAALQSSVARMAGVGDINMAPDTVISGFCEDGRKWRGKDGDGNRTIIWIAEIAMPEKG